MELQQQKYLAQYNKIQRTTTIIKRYAQPNKYWANLQWILMGKYIALEQLDEMNLPSGFRAHRHCEFENKCTMQSKLMMPMMPNSKWKNLLNSYRKETE